MLIDKSRFQGEVGQSRVSDHVSPSVSQIADFFLVKERGCSLLSLKATELSPTTGPKNAGLGVSKQVQSSSGFSKASTGIGSMH